MSKYQTVVDEDAEDYEAMMAEHKRLLAAREAEQYRKIEKTAELAGHVNKGYEVVPGIAAGISQHKPDLKAAKSITRFTGPAGVLFDVISKTAGFKADVAAGMPMDRALIKHGGRFVLGGAGGSLGAWGGGIVGSVVPGAGTVAGAAAGGHGGQKAGEGLADGLAEIYGDLQDRNYPFQRELMVFGNPASLVTKVLTGPARYRASF